MRYELAVEIARAPADVYAYIADPTHLPEWQGEVAEIRDATGDPLTADPPSPRCAPSSASGSSRCSR